MRAGHRGESVLGGDGIRAAGVSRGQREEIARAYLLAEELEKRTGIEARAVILGYVQRGGVPSAFDRLLGTRLGLYSVDMIKNKKFGRMAALKGTRIVDIPITTAIGKLKLVDDKYYEDAMVFFR